MARDGVIKRRAEQPRAVGRGSRCTGRLGAQVAEDAVAVGDQIGGADETADIEIGQHGNVIGGRQQRVGASLHAAEDDPAAG